MAVNTLNWELWGSKQMMVLWPGEQLFKNYADTGIDKGSQHTKQNLAKLNQPGGRTIHYEIPELINSI